MGFIYCLIGKSGTGKDTALERILNNSELKINKLIPYTTRPKRDNESEGVNYHYVTLDVMQNMENRGEVIEKRFYDTVHGRWYYFTAAVDIVPENDYIVITTQEALQHFFRRFGEENVFVIYLKLDDKIRLERCIKRESEQDCPNYKEVCRRFLTDEEDFCEREISEYLHSCIIDTGAEIDKYVSQITKIIADSSNLKKNN